MIEFPFESRRSERLGSILKPIVPVRVIGPVRSLRLSMLLDSGADVTLIPFSFGEVLGLPLDMSKRGEVQGIGEGELGDIYCIYTERVNLGIVRSMENVWWSLAPHDISVVLELLGGVPDSIVARGKDYLQDGIEDIVFANLDFAGRKMAQIHVSWLDPHKSRKMTIVGSRKMAVFDDMEPSEKIKIYDKGAEKSNEAGKYVSYDEFISIRTGDIVIPKVEMTEPLQIECRHFVDSIANDRQPASGGPEGLRVTEVLEAGQRSLDGGGVAVKIEE